MRSTPYTGAASFSARSAKIHHMLAPASVRVVAPTFGVTVTSGLVYKLALVAHTASGAEGPTPWAPTLAKLPLLLGFDVLGALIVTAVVAGMGVAMRKIAPFTQAPRHIACAGVGGYGFMLALSYHLNRVLGAPLDKAAIDLTFFNTDARTTPGAGAWDAISGSVSPYLSTTGISSLVLGALVPVLILRFLTAKNRPTGNRFRWARFAVSAALLITTIVVLPFLRNGEILGIRVHTFGIERSPLPLIIGSYLRGPWRRLTDTNAPAILDPFCLPQRSIVHPQDYAAPLLTVGPSQRHNIVFVILESVGLVNQPNPSSAMPFLHKLGQGPGAVIFSSHYSHWPQTMKSHFNILCSELPYPEYPPITHVNPAIPCVTLFEAAKRVGYSTALFTSADLAYDRQRRFYVHRKLDQIRDNSDMPGRQDAWANSWGVDERVTIAAVLAWIDKQRPDPTSPPRPFAAVYGMAAGHHPYAFPGSAPLDENIPGAAEEAYTVSLRYIDQRIQELWEGLSSRGLMQNTVLVVLSDHGPRSGKPGFGTVRDPTLYEGSVRVPLVIVAPSIKGPHPPITEPTAHLDVAPTALALAGIAIPMTMKGRDLSSSTQPRILMLGTRPPPAQYGARDGRFKLILSGETGSVELFDVEADPAEAHNLAATEPVILKDLSTRVRLWQAHSRDLIENYASILRTRGRRCE